VLFRSISVWDENKYFSNTQEQQTNLLLSNYGNKTFNSLAEFRKFGSYSSVFGNMKLMYDKFNDRNIWVSLIGDITGLFSENVENKISAVGYDLPIKNTIRLLTYITNIDNRVKLNNNGINLVTYNNLRESIIFDSITTIQNNNNIMKELHKRLWSNKIKKYIRDNFFSLLLKLNSNTRNSYVVQSMSNYLSSLANREIITNDFNININKDRDTLLVKINLTFNDILRNLNFVITVNQNNIKINEV
jgi:hypothetical protein